MENYGLEALKVLEESPPPTPPQAWDSALPVCVCVWGQGVGSSWGLEPMECQHSPSWQQGQERDIH